MQFKIVWLASLPRWGIFSGGLGFLLLLFSCTNPNYTPPENALDAGRQFADAVYKGNFKRAADLIVPDEQNKKLLTQKLEEPYHQRTSTDRNLLSQASLQILEVDDQSKDSITYIRILNAYTNQPATMKVVKSDDGWRVDLKYGF